MLKWKIDKHKAKLKVKGYKQQYGFDYNDVFVPVAHVRDRTSIYFSCSPDKMENLSKGCQIRFLEWLS